MHENGTHQQTLLAAVMRTRGPVLELGAGYYSTPILHEVCRAQDRTLLTLDFNEEWFEKFRHFESRTHAVRLVKNWDACEEIDGFWAVAFVDHSPGERRKFEVDRLRGAGCTYIVVHDTEPNPAAGYGLEPVFARFKYRRDFSELTPWTTVVSDVREIWRD